MTRRKSRKKCTHPRRPLEPPRWLLAKLAKADELLDRRRWGEAAELLEPLARQYPRSAEVFERLYNAYIALSDPHGMLWAITHLAELRPHEPDVMLILAGVYLTNIHIGLAVHTFRQFLERWPDDSRAAEVRETLAEMEVRLQEAMAEVGLPPGVESEEVILLHDQIQVALNDQDTARVQHLAEQLLARGVPFAAPLNNLSLSYWLDGDVERAIETAWRVLDEVDPENYHALSNLIHYLVAAGRADEARAYAERLKAVQVDKVDLWSKKAEGLTYLGDDAGVVQVFAQADRAGMLKPPFADPYLFHLTAAARARLGDEREARRLWRQALKLRPGLVVARENLEDLRQPVGERHAPWALTLWHWLPHKTMQDLVRLLQPVAHKSSERAVERAARRFLEQHSEVATLVPTLLERGDPEGRQFAFRIARLAETPDMHAALHHFAFSQDGPDNLRREAAFALVDAGLLPRGSSVRLWIEGEWRELLLFGYEITGEPKVKLPRAVQRLVQQAVDAMYSGSLDQAEALLQRALEKAPGTPQLLQNLATLHALRGDEQRAEELTRDIVECHPDYIIGRCNMAMFALRRGDVEETHRWLDAVLEEKSLHLSEFAALCKSQIELLLREGKPDGARAWLQMWEEIDPDHRELPAWRRRVRGGRGGRLFSRRP